MFLFILFILLPSKLFAARLDPIIVTSKTESTSSNITTSHSLLTQEDLDQKMTGNVIESLRSLPGVFINQTGGPGSQASLYLRGSEVRHVLVLIDGVKVNDPSNPDKQFNAANLTSLDIDRIEVIKGAQTVLYGSDAIGGVINIITKKGEPKQKMGLEIGFQTQVDGSISIVRDRSVTYVNVFAAQSDGISAKKDGEEKDGYLKKGLTLNHSHSFDLFEAQWMFKVLNDFVEDDGYDTSFNFVDDDKAYSKSDQRIFKQSLIFNKNIGIIKHTISHNQIKRHVNYLDTVISDYVETNYEGVTLINDLNLLKKFAMGEAVIGATHEYEIFEKSEIESRKANLYSIYTSLNHKIRQYFFNIGLRGDNHQAFGSVLNYNIGLGKKFGNRQSIKLNHAIGFKAPSIYQLYVPQDGPFVVGNENLGPEKSKTFDLTYSKMGWNNYQITLFNSYIYNYFYFSASGYSNQGSFNSTGLELSAQQKNKRFTFKQGATFSKFSLSGDNKVLRRPEQKIDFGLDYKISDYTLLNLNWMWIGNRFDKSAAGDEFNLEAYDLLNLSFKYKEKIVDYQLGINNLFDRKYTDIYDYGTLGFTVYAKMNYFY